ncbi:hypothetical protein JCM3770_002827 [Rhodotorula araucariae]
MVQPKPEPVSPRRLSLSGTRHGLGPAARGAPPAAKVKQEEAPPMPAQRAPARLRAPKQEETPVSMTQRSHLPTPSPALSSREAPAATLVKGLDSDMDLGTQLEADSLSSADSEFAGDTECRPNEDGREEESAVVRNAEGLVAIEQLPIPNMPKPTDSYAAMEDLYSALFKAIVPVYGIGLTRYGSTLRCNRADKMHRTADGRVCKYMIRARRDPATNRLSVDYENSALVHSHGPDPRILADPAWRPYVRNPEARVALGLPPIKPTAKASKEARGAHTGLNRAVTEVETEGGMKRASTVSANPPPAKKPRLSAPPALAPSIAAPAWPRLTCPRPKSDQPASPALAPSVAVTRPEPIPDLPAQKGSSVLPPGKKVYPAGPPWSTSAKVARSPAHPSRPPMPTATVPAFLRSLHPSLQPLSPHLAHAGFDSAAALTSLVLLDPAILDLTLDRVRLAAEDPRTRPRGARGPVSVIQLKLLAKVLKEAGKEVPAAG